MLPSKTRKISKAVYRIRRKDQSGWFAGLRDNPNEYAQHTQTWVNSEEDAKEYKKMEDVEFALYEISVTCAGGRMPSAKDCEVIKIVKHQNIVEEEELDWISNVVPSGRREIGGGSTVSWDLDNNKRRSSVVSIEEDLSDI